MGTDNLGESMPVSRQLVGFIAGCFTILVMFWSLRDLFWHFPDPRSKSDVILSVEVLYERFKNGIYPYQPLEQYAWHPFPPYLPMYWLPVTITDLIDKDVRWSGVFVFILATGVYGIFCWKHRASLVQKSMSLLLPLISLLGYVYWSPFDLAVSFEFVIAAYYLILAAGLAMRSLPIVVLGIVCCLLSRFTMIFWLPLFVVLLWINTADKKKVFIAAGVVVSAVLLIYIIPFHLQDTSAFGKALAYYKSCAISEWEGMGRERISWTFTPGVHLAPYLRDLFTGTMAERVSKAQTMQAVLMFLLVIAGLLAYKKWRKKVNFYDFSLGSLYVIMLLYFMTAPLVFKYYYFTFLMVSATICAKLILAGKRREANVELPS